MQIKTVLAAAVLGLAACKKEQTATDAAAPAVASASPATTPAGLGNEPGTRHLDAAQQTVSPVVAETPRTGSLGGVVVRNDRR